MVSGRASIQPKTNKERIVMKSLVCILAIALVNVAPVRAQGTAKPAASPSPAPSTTSATTRPDVYHVHFTKAALGKAAQLADWLKAPDPKATMPGHDLVLRHQEGDSWDYVVISHEGNKATVEAAGNLAPPDKRDLSECHNDTFVNGPAWSDFARAMGIDDASKSKSSGSVYVVSVFRAAPGHRDQLEKMLGEAPRAQSGDKTAGNVMMQHLEGSPWQFLTITRHNSWQDFATSDSNAVTQMSKNQGPWFELREHIAFHTDTLTDRIAP
jgi:hypothetical protein